MIVGKSNLDVDEVDERGILMMYPSRPEDLSSRKAVMGKTYEGDELLGYDSSLRDVVTQNGFDGDMEAAAESASPAPAKLLHPAADVDVLKELEQNGERDRYAVRRYSFSIEPNDELIRYVEASDSFVPVNPDGFDELTNYKGRTHDFLHDESIPTIPSIEIDEAVDRGESYTINEIGEIGEGYVIKSQTGSEGDQQYRARNWDEVIETFDEEKLGEMRNSYLLQPFIPHEEGHRWMTYGGEPRTGMVRRRGEGYQTNVSGDQSTEMDTLRAIRDNRIDHLEPEQHEDTELAEAAVASLAEEYADPALERPNIITSVDLMAADREALEGLPESYLEDIDRYSGDSAYMVTEFEPFPGKMIDHMHMWEDPQEGIPALQEAVFLEELAGNEPGEPGDIAGNVDNRIWNRVRASFLSRENMAASAMKHDMLERSRNERKEEETERKDWVSTGP